MNDMYTCLLTSLNIISTPVEEKSMENAINEDLNRLETYFENNKLSLNVDKCEFLLIGTHQQLSKCCDISIKMCNIEVKKVEHSKYLGITIDKHIKWDKHIDILKSKLSSKVGLLYRLRKTVPLDTIMQLYNSIVLPHFDYCDIIYGQCSNVNLEKIQKLQNRAARILSGSGPRENRINMFKRLKWLSLKNRQLLHKCNMIYKSLNNLAPSYMSNALSSLSHSHNTRNCNKLKIKPHRTEYYANSFEISGPTTYNNLPDNIRCATSINSFNSRLYKHLLTLPQF